MHGFAGLTQPQQSYQRRGGGYSPQSLSLLGIESHLHIGPVQNSIHGVVGSGRSTIYQPVYAPAYYPTDRTRFYYS